MSEDQKKQGMGNNPNQPIGGGGGVTLPNPLAGQGVGPSKAPLPGLGTRPSKAPLPGLGTKPSKAPLPGLGAGPSKAPLPGLGSKPTGGPAPLPGLGQPSVQAPPFMQPQEPEAPQQPSAEDVERDPFGQAAAPVVQSVRPSFTPNEGLISASGDPSVSFSEADAGRSRLPFFLGLLAVGLIALLFGFLMGKGKSTREELNVTIRDALIIEYEVKKVANLFNEIQTVLNTALVKANKREFDTTHVGFLSQKVQGNPIKPMLFTERNYKRFDAAAVQWLMDYNQKWFRLDKLIQSHRMQTKNDETALKASGEALQKLFETSYGVVFSRNKKADNQFEANLVVFASGSKDGAVKVQAATGTYADERTLYNPEPGDGNLTKEPDKYVVTVGEVSKIGLLANASQSHFRKYQTRLKEMSDLMRGMNDLQTNLLQKLAEICSQDPVALGKIDPIAELENYKQRDGAAGSAG
ncbi:MAG: hypothetical protein QNJ97_22405 [Myxococcota bacterium]|nr:hypothetical protein [Myxococcota bacterium]